MDFFFTIVFILLCLLHYFSLRPLWLDEDLIYQIIIHNPIKLIFNVLPGGQVFPRFQLALIKIFSQPFAYHLLAVRFFSLVAMVSAVILWYRIYRREKSDNLVPALLMLSFACSYRLTYYSAELKPYAMDVCVVAAYLFYFQRMKSVTQDNWRYFCFGSIALPILGLFTQVGWLVSWILPFNFLLLFRKERFYPVLFMVSVVAAIFCFGLFYYFDLQYSLQSRGINTYWKSYFICYESFGCFFDTFGDGVKKITTYWYGTNKTFIRSAVVFIPFFLYGLFRFGAGDIKKERGVFTIAGLGLILFAELFVLGSLQKYPFTGERITLFFAPFVFYFIIRSIMGLKRIKLLYYLFGGYYFLYCLVSLVNTYLTHLHLYKF